MRKKGMVFTTITRWSVLYFFSDWFLQDTCSHNWLLHRLFLKNTTFLEKKARCNQLKPATHAPDLTFCLCRGLNPGLQIQDTCSPHWGHRLSPYEMALPIWISRQFKHPPSGPFGPPAWVVHSVSFCEFLSSFEWGKSLGLFCPYFEFKPS